MLIENLLYHSHDLFGHVGEELFSHYYREKVDNAWELNAWDHSSRIITYRDFYHTRKNEASICFMSVLKFYIKFTNADSDKFIAKLMKKIDWSKVRTQAQWDKYVKSM